MHIKWRTISSLPTPLLTHYIDFWNLKRLHFRENFGSGVTPQPTPPHGESLPILENPQNGRNLQTKWRPISSLPTQLLTHYIDFWNFKRRHFRAIFAGGVTPQHTPPLGESLPILENPPLWPQHANKMASYLKPSNTATNPPYRFLEFQAPHFSRHVCGRGVPPTLSSPWEVTTHPEKNKMATTCKQNGVLFQCFQLSYLPTI